MSLGEGSFAGKIRPLALTVWRVVEAQHKVSTRRLVDTLDEQALLEEIVDEVKPARPSGPRFEGLHFLLFTPFRHPPLRHGSRFCAPSDRGAWYGAVLLETGLAEKAYYQLLFAAGTRARLDNLSCLWSAFQAAIKTPRAVDLTGAAFAAHQATICSPTSYAAAQQLGAELRGAGVEACVYRSARCPKRGKAVALFEPAFARRDPVGAAQTWLCSVTDQGCEVRQMNITESKVLVFPRAAFEVDGHLPAPGLAAA